MSVHKEGNAWYMSFMFKGIRVHEPTRARTKTAALLIEADRRKAMAEGRNERQFQKSPTLAEFGPEFLKFYEDSKVHAQKTKNTYTNGWRLLSSTILAHRRLSDIWSSEVDTVEFPGSGSNANQALRTLRRMLGMAAEQKLIQAPPVIHLRDENRRDVTLDDWVGQDVESLLLELANPTLHDFMIMMLDAGPRPDEISRFRREDIKWSKQAIFIPKGKTKKARRHIPMSDRMADVLRDRLAGHTSQWVFPSAQAKSGHIAASSIGKMWKALKAEAAVELEKRKLPPLPEGLVPYSCKHTFATRFIEVSGDNRSALTAILGHASFATTERYIHGRIKGAADLMNRFNENRCKVVPLAKRA